VGKGWRVCLIFCGKCRGEVKLSVIRVACEEESY